MRPRLPATRCRTGCCASSRRPAVGGEDVVDALLTAWGPRFFARGAVRDDSLLAECVAVCGLDPALIEAAGDEKWDAPIVEAMEVAYAFGGPKTQTPTIVVRDDPPHGFKGPVMAPAPTGERALQLWDADPGDLPGGGLLRDHTAHVHAPRLV